MVVRRSHNPKVVSSILTRRMPAGQELATLKVGQDAEAEARIEPTRVDPLGTASRRPNRPPTTPPRKLGEARGKRESRGDGEAGIEPTRADPSALQAAVSTASTHPHPEIGRGEGQAGIGPTRADPKALHSVRLTTIRAAAANHCALLPFTAHLAHDSGAKTTERPSQFPDRAIKQTVMALR